MRRHFKQKRLMSEINVVPYIDVMLVLLVIFMITAPLLTEGVKIDLPQAEQSETIDPVTEEPLIIDVDRDGRYYIRTGDEPTPLDAQTLVARVTAVLRHRPGIPVYVGGDEATAYGNVMVVIDLLKRAGVPSVGLLTERIDTTDT